MTRKLSNKQIGSWGEAQAAAWLGSHGYQIIGQNLYTPYGEIDILARKQGQLIFVEVKTRQTNRFGHPEEAVTASKIQHMVESAEHYLQEHPDLEANWQIDVIAIQYDPKTRQTTITHFENAV
ncbi:MAG: YraN family protein [Anaerolineales bacterium]|nr:YraN family protein [Anaerolineales bacterium]